MTIDDAKGLEFSTVIALSGRMSENEKYIAYTRALDELFVYDVAIDVSAYAKGPKKTTNKEAFQGGQKGDANKAKKNAGTSTGQSKKNDGSIKDYSHSKVREFFISRGLEVVDMRDKGGVLWVVGSKDKVGAVINEAVKAFSISGHYSSGKAIKNREGWFTKTDK